LYAARPTAGSPEWKERQPGSRITVILNLDPIFDNPGYLPGKNEELL
jgi:hypothetical protein